MIELDLGYGRIGLLGIHARLAIPGTARVGHTCLCIDPISCSTVKERNRRNCRRNRRRSWWTYEDGQGRQIEGCLNERGEHPARPQSAWFYKKPQPILTQAGNIDTGPLRDITQHREDRPGANVTVGILYGDPLVPRGRSIGRGWRGDCRWGGNCQVWQGGYWGSTIPQESGQRTDIGQCRHTHT